MHKTVETCFLLLCISNFSQGHTLVFADQSGVTASGHVMLGTMDVHHQWTKVMWLHYSRFQIPTFTCFPYFFFFWFILCFFFCSYLSSCLSISACGSTQTGWRRGLASCWVELKLSTWRVLEQSNQLLGTIATSACSTEPWCPNGFTYTLGACRDLLCFWTSMLCLYLKDWNTTHRVLLWN